MSSAGVRLLTAVLVTGSIGLAFVPVAQADSSTTLLPIAEGWYQPNPTCGTPAGCVAPGTLPATPPTPLPPVSPFPARTMHIGLSAGQETARSYLGIDFADVPGDITGGSLTVPLDVAPADGSISPETAKVQVCLTSDPISSVDASFDQPPKADCTHSVPASYVATPQPHLSADLSGITDALLDATGLALLPDATKAAQTDSWRVVFSAHDRTDAAKTAPASADLTIADTTDTSGDTSGDFPVVAPTEPPQAAGPPVGTGFAGPPLQAPAPVPTAPAVLPTTAPSQQVAAPGTITVGYAYPGVWLLPLGFLVLVPAAARALTKDLSEGLA